MPLVLEQHGRVMLVTLNRPEALNALNSATLHAFVQQVVPLDQRPDVGCIVLTGSERAFAAGADIREMASQTLHQMRDSDYFAGWEAFASMRTPRIAAVSGYALGGGCELAMMCDMVFAAEGARFGQPEIKLGVIPGIGGTQRLTRLVGRSRAMDLILSGRLMDASEAERAGLVARVYSASELLPQTLAAAQTIASYSLPAVRVAKEAVDRAAELSLREGLLFERRAFHSLFATRDQKEGMQAFLDKRQPRFTGE